MEFCEKLKILTFSISKVAIAYLVVGKSFNCASLFQQGVDREGALRNDEGSYDIISMHRVGWMMLLL